MSSDFEDTAEHNGVIRAVAAPGAADASRKQVDAWSEIARANGAAGVLPGSAVATAS